MKTEFVQLRVRADEKTFEHAASLAGLPLSAWIRERLRRAARIELMDANRPEPFLEKSS